MVGLIVHEWVEKTGGSERVVDQFMTAFPDADLQVLWNNDPDRFGSRRVYETWLAGTPLRNQKALALPFLPRTWRRISARRSYDWILASSHLFAHHVQFVNADREIPKYSYVHTPARYIWEPDLDGRGNHPLVRAASSRFKGLDKKRAQESVKMAANSEFTRDRIRKVWDRDADVIYPPVDTEKIIAGGDWRNMLIGREADLFDELPETFLLGASRFVPYKRLDLVIGAGEAVGVPVVIAGSGPGLEQLEAMAAVASVPVVVIESPSDALLYALYQQSLAFVFPAIEDFGIMPVEAMAAGAPVIVSSTGGASESAAMLNGGVSVSDFSAQEWRRAVDSVSGIDRNALSARTRALSEAHFRARVARWIGPHSPAAHQQSGGEI